jgi:hypothetical protein
LVLFQHEFSDDPNVLRARRRLATRVLFLPAAAGMEQFFERFAGAAGEASAVAESFAALAEVGDMKIVGSPLVRKLRFALTRS